MILKFEISVIGLNQGRIIVQGVSQKPRSITFSYPKEPAIRVKATH
jgi:hypothetical protein